MKTKYKKAAERMIDSDIASHFRRRSGRWPLSVTLYARMVLEEVLGFHVENVFKDLLRQKGYDVQWSLNAGEERFVKAKKAKKRAKP